MANFRFVVDTEEMADAVHEVSPHVDGATAAVVAMKVSVIEAEREAAESICDHVNRGFHTLIRSQISQKIAAIRSQIDARLLELRDQARKMLDCKKVMMRDFQMIAARNNKLFQSLDAALLHRVGEVDKPAVDLARQELGRIRRRYENSQAVLPIHQLETVASTQLIAASRTKTSAFGAIGAMERFASDSARQVRLATRILYPTRDPGPAALSMPLIAAEVDTTPGVQPAWRLFVSPQTPPALARAAEQTAKTLAFSAPERAWQQAGPGERNTIEELVRARVARSNAPDRVKREILRLFAASTWQRFREGGA